MFKKLIIKIISYIVFQLYNIIEIIERRQYKNKTFIDDSVEDKIIDTILLSNIEVYTDTGWKPATHIHKTKPFEQHIIETEHGLKLICADKHILFTTDYKEIFAENISIGSYIYTINGLERVINIESNNISLSMMDITVDSNNHRYYTNGILSHNTVSAGIYILHFMLFNNTKNVLLAANKLETSTEVLDKIKEIYKYLPFFLKKGIEIWNTRMIKFENTSRAKAFAMTKNSSIGNTGDLVYLDEFAHINENISNHFYRSVLPTLDSITNSKIIITSTPNGPNLFMRLLLDAERSEDDPEKTDFSALRVYWHQVPGRNVVYIKLYDKVLRKFNITKDEIFQQCLNRFDPENTLKTPNNDPLLALKRDPSNGRTIINLNQYHGVTLDEVKQMKFFNTNGDELPIILIGQVSTWKLDAIKNIGGEDNFNQEYDLRFSNSSRSVLSDVALERLTLNKKQFEYIPNLPPFNKLRWDNSGMIFHPEIDVLSLKNMFGIVTVDVSEGLGNDYSVINIFKLMYKPIELIKEQLSAYKSYVDFFQLKQVAKYRSNIIGTDKLAEILYLILFDFLNSDKIKCIVEYNNDGKTLLAELKNLYDKNSDYTPTVMMKFLHRIDGTEKKIGLLVNNNKKQLVKDYQDAIEAESVVIEDVNTVREAGHFVKHTTPAGKVTYKAEGSVTDDDIMTTVHAAHGIKNAAFKYLVDEFRTLHPNIEIDKIIDTFQGNVPNTGTDYSSFSNVMNMGGYKRLGNGGGINISGMV